MIGIAPIDFDINSSMYDKCGWYFYLYGDCLYSGPPHNYVGEYLKIKKEDESKSSSDSGKKKKRKKFKDEKETASEEHEKKKKRANTTNQTQKVYQTKNQTKNQILKNIKRKVKKERKVFLLRNQIQKKNKGNNGYF